MKYLLLILLLSFNAFCDSISSYEFSDESNFRAWDYTDNGIYRLDAFLLHTTKIDFDQGESVVDVNAVDLSCISSWYFKKSENSIFVTSMKQDCDTLVRVQTTKSQYFFDMRSKIPTGNFKNEIVLMYTFFYPAPKIDGKESGIDIIEFKKNQKIECIPVVKNKNNYNYGISESQKSDSHDMDISPVLVFDDGKFTYMKFPKTVPSIFAVDKNGYESSVNFQSGENGCIRVSSVEKLYSLKYGPATVCVLNQSK